MVTTAKSFHRILNYNENIVNEIPPLATITLPMMHRQTLLAVNLNRCNYELSHVNLSFRILNICWIIVRFGYMYMFANVLRVLIVHLRHAVLNRPRVAMLFPPQKTQKHILKYTHYNDKRISKSKNVQDSTNCRLDVEGFCCLWGI